MYAFFQAEAPQNSTMRIGHTNHATGSFVAFGFFELLVAQDCAKSGHGVLAEPTLASTELESQLAPQEVKEEAPPSAQGPHLAAKLQQYG